jgi:hypothetical protein
MNTSTIIGDLIILYGYIDRETCERVNVCAKLPRQEYNDERVHVIDWKIDDGVVRLTYQMRNDAYAPIFDTKFVVVQDRSKLPRPNKSKNWELDQYQDLWRNRKTGQKVYV